MTRHLYYIHFVRVAIGYAVAELATLLVLVGYAIFAPGTHALGLTLMPIVTAVAWLPFAYGLYHNVQWPHHRYYKVTTRSYHTGMAMLVISLGLSGVFEIALSQSPLLVMYWIISGIFLLVSVVFWILMRIDSQST